MPRTSQDGLGWKETLWGLVPQWTRDVSTAAVEEVCRRRLHIPRALPCSVTFHASGLFNKIYRVDCAPGPLIMRVALPVYPGVKTRAEVATLQWVADKTSVPVPRVLAYDDSNDNEIGCEWIMLELMPGTPVRKRWRTLAMDKKVELTKRIADVQVQLMGLGTPRRTFAAIGTLALGGPGDESIPGPLVSHEFFAGEHRQYNIPRGPFRASYDWLRAQLDIVHLHQTRVLEEAEDERDRADAAEILCVARKLLCLFPAVFAADVHEPETTGLYHSDLHLGNILVDDAGDIAAVLDWECVSAMPLWMLLRGPKFLDGPVRETEPQRDSYADASDEEADAASEQGSSDADSLDNEGKTELYFDHVMEYEATQLRKVFVDTLRTLWPAWDAAVEESTVKMDFVLAVQQCDGFWARKAARWADRIEKGDDVRFEDA